VARAHGVRGELRLKVYNLEADVLLHQREVMLRDPGGAERSAEIEAVRKVDGALLVKLRGIGDRDAAQALQRTLVCVRRDALEPVEEGEFYLCDLIGAELIGPAGSLGTVEEILDYPTASVLAVRLSAGSGRVEIPLLEAFIERVDVEGRAIFLRADALDLFS
jgi:16S rRNA processing protein RimM